MEKSKKILKAKEDGDKFKVQKLQQRDTVLTDMESEDLYNNIMKKVDNEVIDDIGQRYDPTTTIEDVVEYIKEHYPETEETFKKELNNMYLTFCRKQFDYGPNNIAMGTLLSNDKEINTSLLGIIVRLNDKVNRLVNLATKHGFKAQNEPMEDAFLDVAIYSVMALIVKSGKWSK